MKSQIPGRKPGVFPLVRHRDHVIADQMEPFAVTDALARIGPERVGSVFFEPLIVVEEEVLLAPQHAGQCLPHDICRVIADASRYDCPVKLAGLTAATIETLLELRIKRL